MNQARDATRSRSARAFDLARALVVALAILVLVLDVARAANYLVGTVLIGQFERGPLLLDYVAQYTAGRMLLEGDAGCLYCIETQAAIRDRLLGSAAVESGYEFIGTPLLAAIATPFAALPYAWAYLGWLVANLAMLVAATRLLATSRRAFWIGLGLSLAFVPTHQALIFGQTSVLTLLATALAIRATLAGRTGWAGIFWSIWSVKPNFLLAPLVALVGGRQWRTLIALALFALLAPLLALPWLGSSYPLDYLALLRWASERAAVGDDHSGVTWLMLFQVLAPGLGVAALAPALAASAITLATLAWLWRRATLLGGPTWLLALAAIPPATLLVSLHAHEYEPVVCLASGWLLVGYAGERPRLRGAVMTALLLGFVALDLFRPALVPLNFLVAVLACSAFIAWLVWLMRQERLATQLDLRRHAAENWTSAP